MKKTSTLPNKKSIFHITTLINKLLNEYSKLEVYIKQSRTLLLENNKKYFFVSFPLEHSMSAKTRMKYFDKNISVIKKDKNLHFLSPIINFSFEKLTEISEITNELQKLYEIDNNLLTKSEKQKLLYKKKEYWNKYLFNFGEVLEDNDSLNILEGDFIMAKELKFELNRVKKILEIINKFNSPIKNKQF